MAIFSNQATLTYNGNTTNSNIAYGEILEVLEVTKTAVEDNYTPDGVITYAVTLLSPSTVLPGPQVPNTITIPPQDSLPPYPDRSSSPVPPTPRIPSPVLIP